MVGCRAIAELTREQRATNHRPILSYPILLCVAEPVDVFQRVELPSGNEQVKVNQPDMHDAALRVPLELLWCLWIYAGWI